jgi:hypothetical protein
MAEPVVSLGWRPVPLAITLEQAPALHVVVFERALPLGFARCLRCRQVVRLSERLQECPGEPAMTLGPR